MGGYMNTEAVALDMYNVQDNKSLLTEPICARRRGIQAVEHGDYQLVLAPSYACDLHCNHCYLPEHNPHGLDESDVLRVIEEWSDIVLVERGPMGGTFHLKGGEPLMLSYLDDILSMLRYKRTLRFAITTTGMNANTSSVRLLRKLNRALHGNVVVNVIIDGSNDVINTKYRGRSGSFVKAVKFVHRIRRAGIKVCLHNTVHQENIDDLEAFVHLALHLGVDQVKFIPFVAGDYVERMRYTEPDPVELYNRIEQISDAGGRKVEKLLQKSLRNIMDLEASKINFSTGDVQKYRGFIYIVPDGSAYSCPDSNHFGVKAGNIKKSSLLHIHNLLSNKLYAVRTAQNRFDFADY